MFSRAGSSSSPARGASASPADKLSPPPVISSPTNQLPLDPEEDELEFKVGGCCSNVLHMAMEGRRVKFFGSNK